MLTATSLTVIFIANYNPRNILFFVSDREGGKGGFDIWYSFWDRKHKRWMEPINAKEINTVFDEEAPLEVEASKYDLNYIKLDGNIQYQKF